MKMVTAIINSQDSRKACSALTDAKIAYTKMATTGGFLKKGNTTLLIGVEDDKVDALLGIIKKNCSTRKITVPSSASAGYYSHGMVSVTEVVVGGAIIFVSPVERFEKI